MKKNEFNFQEMAEMKRREADRIEILEEIYVEIKNSMQWNIMSQTRTMKMDGIPFQTRTMITDTINTKYSRKF